MDAWKTTDVRDPIAKNTRLPVYLENDATAACGAELVFGQAVGLRDFIYFYIGYFIGGGVVLNGNLFVGPKGNAGAFGSILVPSSDGQTQQLIDVASIATLERMVNVAGGSSALLLESCDDWCIDARLLEDWIEKAAQAIAYAMVSSMAVIEYEVALIDGWMAASVRAAIVQAVSTCLTSMDLKGINEPKVAEGTVGPNARALGAASLPLSQRFLVEKNTYI